MEVIIKKRCAEIKMLCKTKEKQNRNSQEKVKTARNKKRIQHHYDCSSFLLPNQIILQK